MNGIKILFAAYFSVFTHYSTVFPIIHFIEKLLNIYVLNTFLVFQSNNNLIELNVFFEFL